MIRQGRLEREPEQVPLLMTLFGAGWTAVNLAFAALYGHAWRHREALQLSPTEAQLTRNEGWQFLGCAGVGALAICLAYGLPLRYSGLSGFTYSLTAIVGTLHGHYVGEVRKAGAAVNPPDGKK